MTYSGTGLVVWMLTGVVGAGMLSIPRQASACGGGGIASQTGVVVDSQRIVISSRANGTTDIVAQISVPRTLWDYGVLIPVPSEPTIDTTPVSARDLAALDSGTAPQFVPKPSDPPSSGCGCGSAGDDDASGGPTRGVTASPPVEIGPVVAVALTGDSDEAIVVWLAEHGFILPSSSAAILANYVGEGNYFIAIRRSDSAANGSPTSIGIHYSLVGDHRKLSLGFTRLGAAPVVAYTVFLGAKEATGPSAPFIPLTIDDVNAGLWSTGFYKTAVQTLVASHDSKAFVLESVTPVSAVAARAPSLARFFDEGTVITRATTVLESDKISDDVVFATPFEKSVPSTRYALLNVLGPRVGSYGPLGVGLMAIALRRRRRQTH